MTGIELLLSVLIMVESGGDVNAVGDGGASLGPLQIQRACYTDAVAQIKREGGTAPPAYEVAAVDPVWARTLARAYWRRYCPQAYAEGDYQTLARVWNGGPSGAKKAATVPYWEKVKRELNRRTGL